MIESPQHVRFVLVGLGRCGSNLLKFAFKQNPEINMVGEYFNHNVHPESVTEPGSERAKQFFASSKVRASGFKLFEHQARRKPAKSVWRLLADDPDLKVIHLSRRNSFKRLLSLELAKARGQWVREAIDTDIRINLPPEAWAEMITQDEEREAKLEHIFTKQRSERVFYEDMIPQWSRYMWALQEFLEVEPIELNKTLKKQESMTPSDRCPNYNDIVTYFSNTNRAWMFD